MNEKLEAILSQYGLSAEQLSGKTNRKVKDLDKIENCKLPTVKNPDGTLKPKSQEKADDLFSDIQREILETYEEIEEAKQKPTDLPADPGTTPLDPNASPASNKSGKSWLDKLWD